MRTGWSKREGEEKWKGQGLGREEKRRHEVGGEMDRSKTGGGSPCHHCNDHCKVIHVPSIHHIYVPFVRRIMLVR